MTPGPGTSLTLAVLLLVAPVLAGAQREAERRAGARGEDVYLADQSVDVTRDVPGDLVAAGGAVRVGAPVAETAILAGGSVAIDGSVGDDVIAAGGEVALRGHAGDDARLAGGTVRIAGRVDDDVTAAAGTVRIDRDAVVGGRAWLAGGEIVVAGMVGREVRASGRHVSLEGTVRGDVQVWAESLDIGPAARIDGDVVHHGPREPRIDPGARIGGRVEHRPTAEAPPARALAALAWLLFLPALFVTGVVLVLVFPRFARAAAETVGADPWPSLGVGAAVLLGAPAVMVALFATAIGVPLGLVLLAGYPVALLVGYLVAALFLGVVAAARLRRRPAASSRGALVLGLLAGLVVLGLLGLVPVLGGLVSLAALLFGVGALVTRLYRAYRGDGGAPATAAQRAPRQAV